MFGSAVLQRLPWTTAFILEAFLFLPRRLMPRPQPFSLTRSLPHVFSPSPATCRPTCCHGTLLSRLPSVPISACLWSHFSPVQLRFGHPLTTLKHQLHFARPLAGSLPALQSAPRTQPTVLGSGPRALRSLSALHVICRLLPVPPRKPPSPARPGVSTSLSITCPFPLLSTSSPGGLPPAAALLPVSLQLCLRVGSCS